MRGHWPRRALRRVRFAAIALVAVAAVGLIVMLLWNALMPQLFGWRSLSYLQAVGLLVLARLLFGRFGRPGYGIGPWRRHWMAHWANISPQEREQLLARMRAGGPWGCHASGTPKAHGSSDSGAASSSET